MTQDQAEYITDAIEMSGKGYEPSAEIEQPRSVTERRDGKLVEVERQAFVKLYTSFKKELKDIDGDALKVWLFLALSVNRQTKNANPGLRTIAEETGMSVNTVRSKIEYLDEVGLLEAESRLGRQGNSYKPADYVSVERNVSKSDTLKNVSNLEGNVSKSGENVSVSRRENAQLEELELTRKTSTLSFEEIEQANKLVDAIISNTQPPEEKYALNAFERAFQFGTLPWYSTGAWSRFAKFIIKQHPFGWFDDYVEWRNGEGKYKAFSNRKIRENPAAFIDTGYPEYEASKMYRKTIQPEKTILPDDSKAIPNPFPKKRFV